MKPEREIKLSVTPGFRLPDMTEVVEGLTAVRRRARRLTTIYYDTRDLRLARWGLSLRYRQREGWTLKLAPTEEAAFLERDELVFPGARSAPPPQAVDLVTAYVRGRNLRPTVSLSAVRRPLELCDGLGRTVVEIVSDEVSISGGRSGAGFREVEVEIKEPVPAKTVTAVVRRLRDAGAGEVSTKSKYLRALGTRGDRPAEVVVPSVGGGDTVGDVIRAAVATSVLRLFRHDPGVRLGEDPEEVHQARVATRRLRSDLRTFGEFLDASAVEPIRKELAWLGGALGEVRDAEVMIDRLVPLIRHLPAEDAEIAAGIVGRLRVSREQARAALLQAMRTRRYTVLLDVLVAASRTPPVIEAAARSAREAFTPILAHRFEQLVASVAALDTDASDQALHAARIKAKQVRYTAESVAGVFGKQARNFARAVSELQDALGAHQDAVIAGAWLREVAANSQPADAYVIGELASFERQAALAAREGWPAAWKSVSRKRMRFWT